ncbi:hypothetical protein XENOCAPTIV_000838, partial [Xenoophorus captivus]
ITQDDFLLNMEEDQFDRVIQVNLKGSFLVTQAVAQALVACGAPKGSIITLGSIVGKEHTELFLSGSRFGIRCNCVLPGFISTPMTDKVPEKVLVKVNLQVSSDASHH